MTRRPNLIVYVPGLNGPQHSAELIRRLTEHAPNDWAVQTFDHGLAPLSTEPDIVDATKTSDAVVTPGSR